MIPSLLLLLAALTGPADCRFTVPADMHPGAAEWIGPCAANFAEGTGVLRVAQPNGQAELFYGQFHHGVPVQGMFGNSDGSYNNPTHSFNPRTGRIVDDGTSTNPAGQDIKLWYLAAAAARVAQRHYEAIGNQASADFYHARVKQLARGPAE